MKIYRVGGCVRDELLGLDPKDVDYVVVGATPEEMEALGYEKVGASFPVFLKDGSEYALARTERKTGPGYLGFETNCDPNVTLEDDLLRRDLTINSMAKDPNTGEIIDPHGGRSDLDAKILRHTSKAFAEDPIRVLRTARFAARYGFVIAPETLELMERIVPEIEHVPAERVWTEIAKGLMEEHPADMFYALERVGAFEVEQMKPYSVFESRYLEKVSSSDDLVTRFALVSANFKKDDYEQCRIPTECSTVAHEFNKYFAQWATYPLLREETRLEHLYRIRVFNDQWLLNKLLDILYFYNGGCNARYINQDVAAVCSVDAAAIAATCEKGPEIKEKLFQARLAAMKQ